MKPIEIVRVGSDTFHVKLYGHWMRSQVRGDVCTFRSPKRAKAAAHKRLRESLRATARIETRCDVCENDGPSFTPHGPDPE
jgi:hypothetical protein